MNTSDSVDQIVANALASLDLLTSKDIPNLDDTCPICLLTFRAVFESCKDNMTGRTDIGVAKVGGCGHLFCAEDLSEWIKGRHGTCPTCRHEFLPELRPVDSDAESSSDEEYVPTEYDADSDFDTDYEDGFVDGDGIDFDTMEVDHPHFAVDDEAMEREERQSVSSSLIYARYHDSRDPEAQSVCGSEAAWWDGSVDGDRGWGLTDEDSMGTSEGELSFGNRLPGPETNVQVRLDSEGEYAIYEDGNEPKS